MTKKRTRELEKKAIHGERLSSQEVQELKQGHIQHGTTRQFNQYQKFEPMPKEYYDDN